MSAPQPSSARTTSSGDAPYWRAEIDADRHLGDDRLRRVHVARAARSACWISVEIGEGLEDEQVDSAVRKRLTVARERRLACLVDVLVEPVRLDAHAEGSDRASDERFVAGRIARDRGGARDSSLRPDRAELHTARA